MVDPNAPDQQGLELKRMMLSAGFTCIETHISRVYLRGDTVYKTKRPVRFSFLDFSSPENRKRACDAEVRLNRRFAPEVYRGLVAIVADEACGVRFVPESEYAGAEPLAWAVEMLRLPDAVRADVLLANGQLGLNDTASMAQALAEFHHSARSDEDTASFGSERVIRGNVEENFAELAPYIARYLPSDAVHALEAGQRAFLDQKAAVFARRAREGRVRDGHGDLRLEHLYRTDNGRFIAIDCIEFNDRFRYGDVALDLAFLAMDFAYQDRDDLAEHLVASYARETGDFGLYPLIDFYLSYRAVVRAKVSAFLAEDRGVSEAARVAAATQASRSFALALRMLSPTRDVPVLVVCAGLMASGKSTLSRVLGEVLGAPVVSADRIRKQLLQVDPRCPLHDAPFRGSYSADTTNQVYDTLRANAELVLRTGRSVVLDATFRARDDREELCALAKRLGVRVLFFECRVPRDVTMARLAERARRASESDGRADIFDAIAAAFQPMAELGRATHVPLDTQRPVEENVAACLRRVAACRCDLLAD